MADVQEHGQHRQVGQKMVRDARRRKLGRAVRHAEEGHDLVRDVGVETHAGGHMTHESLGSIRTHLLGRHPPFAKG